MRLAPRRIRLLATAETLAAFRIAASFAILFSSELHGALHFAALPPSLRIAPEGLGWFVALVPITEPIARTVRLIAILSGAATLLGAFTRPASVVLFVSTFYLLAVGQLSGTVIHDMHLVWFAAVLAASPAGDVWSIDAWWRRHEGLSSLATSEPTERAGIPVWTARLLFACVYFFPGLHKLLTQGPDWFLSDNLALQLQWKWFEWGAVPSFRLDQHKALLALGGASALAFELTFPLLLWHRRTRLLGALGGLAFHVATQIFFRIPFSSLWLCYPVLVDWRGARNGSGTPDAIVSPSEPPPPPQRASAASWMLGVALFVPIVVQGLRAKMEAFPFACYPTFAQTPPRDVPELRVVVVQEDGTRVEVPHGRDARGVRSQARWGQVWALAGIGQPVSEARLRSYVMALKRVDPARFAGARQVEVSRAFYSVSPERRGAAAVREKHLFTFELEASSAPKLSPRDLRPTSKP